MFGSTILPETLQRFVREFDPKCTPLRGACVIRDELSPGTQIALLATNPGTHADGPPQHHFRELAIVRAGLAECEVEEVFFADLLQEGYALIVQPTKPIGKYQSLAEGCWTFAPESEVELGRLLKKLGELVWRAWEEAAVPLVAEQASDGDDSEEEAEEKEDPASS